ncbi:sigma-70 family RNA polymerase sigma factor [Terrimonas sp. NA20]|uniref:Sigma-70 family RNA polymerase sigma factor n=1 Tax=Terrimonas ginsenosidimutans TaxID=2908004 RepID=A0ABS9KMI0_9BACT|nr:sigma-70 family RNA polymerase sigma factor [Terrimonas ginsenosidimutans]MCG2613519.1 sigma-70 family RNA polymerase sigma factor [Terrimonas ginsenosidimutans]
MDKMNILPDTSLLTQLQAGSHDAFNEIYDRYWNKLYFVAYKHLGEAADAEEIVQEVFITLWSKKSALQIDSLAAYLAAMTRYAVYHKLKQRKKIHITTLEKLDDGSLRHAMEEGSFENKLLLEIVNRLANDLPEKCRLVFINNKLLDRPLPEVAEGLGISIKTAEAHLSKALKIIRTKMGDTFFSLFL